MRHFEYFTVGVLAKHISNGGGSDGDGHNKKWERANECPLKDGYLGRMCMLLVVVN